eukprot:3548676-Prymnesium_polylepis.1
MARRTVYLMTAPSPSQGPLPWPAHPNSTQSIEKRCCRVKGGGDCAAGVGAGGDCAAGGRGAGGAGGLAFTSDHGLRCPSGGEDPRRSHSDRTGTAAHQERELG